MKRESAWTCLERGQMNGGGRGSTGQDSSLAVLDACRQHFGHTFTHLCVCVCVCV